MNVESINEWQPVASGNNMQAMPYTAGSTPKEGMAHTSTDGTHVIPGTQVAGNSHPKGTM